MHTSAAQMLVCRNNLRGRRVHKTKLDQLCARALFGEEAFIQRDFVHVIVRNYFVPIFCFLNKLNIVMEQGVPM